METAKVSIVTPCYNGEKYLERFLKSILNQSYENIELIFINDGSTDHTEEIIKEYKKEFDLHNIGLTYLLQENAGQAAALNNGLKYVQGDYLLCMDSDDEISENFVKCRVRFLQENSAYVYCCGKVEFIKNGSIQIKEKRKECENRLSFFEDILFVKDVFFSGYLMKIDALDKVIEKREIYTGRGGQNAQILLPLAWYYGEPGYVKESIYKYYIHSESHSHSQDTGEKIITQLSNYEKILIETIKRIRDTKAREYIEPVRQYYAKLRYGNAIDTQNKIRIRRYFVELRRVRRPTVKELGLYIKKMVFR